MRRSAWQRTITDANGVPVSGVQINVFLNDGITPATIASSAAGAALTNPFVTSTAVAKFFAMPGLYVVKATKDGQTQTFSDVEIGARNYRDDQGALGGTAVIVDNITNDATIVSEGGSFRFTAAATGKPSFVNSGQVWSAPHDGTPFSFMLGVGLRANSSRAAFIGSRGGVGQAPAWVELWDKTTSPAQAHTTDLTAGALLTPGSFGLGATNSVDFGALGITLDSFSAPSGLFRARAVDTGNKPAGITDFCFLNIRYNTSDQVRVALSLTGEAWTFASAGGTWGANGYRRQYDNINALSAVAFAGGLSTGGLMEYGSNSNGQYYKYADGSLVCTSSKVSTAGNAASGNAWLSILPDWTFPAAFASAPELVGSVKRLIVLQSGVFPSAFARSTSGAMGTTSANSLVLWWHGSSSTVQAEVSLVAFGRWR